MLIKLVGTTFRKNKFSPVIGEEVILNHDRDNQYDDKAVEVLYGTDFLGYLPKGSDAQKLFFEKPFTAKIKDFAHSRGEEDGIKDWNNEGEGYLESVTLEACVEGGTSPANEEEVVSHYMKDGKPYRRISQVAKEAADYFDPEGKQRLKDWQDSIRAKYPDPAEAYLQALAKAGTQLHSMLECEAKNGIGIVQAIEAKLGKIESTEQTVYDDDLMIAGTYDANFTKAMADYKSARLARLGHFIQLAFYAKNKGQKEAYVIPNLGGNQQGFTLTKVDVDKYYGMLVEYLTK